MGSGWRVGEYLASGPRHVGPQAGAEGPVDSAVPAAVRPALLAVLREALSNVARHAEAGAVTVEVTASGDSVGLTVTDDGRGFDPRTADPGQNEGHGLGNMRSRAEDLGGLFAITGRPGEGSVLLWRVPT
jgi:two-component system, NarL family, sensor histidine kinase DevS